MSKHDPYCPSCNSSKWNTCGDCSCCGNACCDQCGVYVECAPFSVICESCAEEQHKALWRVMGPIEETVYEMMGEDEEKVSPELFAAICACATVDEVRAAFRKHSKVIEMPRRGEERRAA